MALLFAVLWVRRHVDRGLGLECLQGRRVFLIFFACDEILVSKLDRFSDGDAAAYAASSVVVVIIFGIGVKRIAPLSRGRSLCLPDGGIVEETSFSDSETVLLLGASHNELSDVR
ncbi:hypothetical protein IWX48DRAFT_625966 [Phyllosticta citricarpa]